MSITVSLSLSALRMSLLFRGVSNGRKRSSEHAPLPITACELLLNPIILDDDGMVLIPDGPGLGLEWNPDGIAKFTGGMALTASSV